MGFAAVHESAIGTNATLGNVRFSAGYEGEADISRSLVIDRDCTRASLVSRAGRQAHRKDRTLPQFARHRHVPAHHACELAREGKAEPGAPETLCSRGIGLAELLEQLSLLLRSHANAGVSDRELDPVATVGDPTRPQPDLAFLGELAG